MRQEVKTLLMINEVQKVQKTETKLLMTEEYGVIYQQPTPSETKKLFFYVMPRYGPNLQYLYHKASNKMSTQTVLTMGIQVLRQLETIHNAGYIYNDLKLDNLLANYDFDLQEFKNKTKDNAAESLKDTQINLIDFGFASKYWDHKTQTHVKQESLDFFRGNLQFASYEALQFMTTSRRDDLKSLLYMMIFLINGGFNEGIDNTITDQLESMQQISRTKKQHDGKTVTNAANIRCLREFANEIFSYGFTSKPNYDLLEQKLREAGNINGKNAKNTFE